MKKLFVALMLAACALDAQAEGDWRTTLGKVKDLSGDTGLSISSTFFRAKCFAKHIG